MNQPTIAMLVTMQILSPKISILDIFSSFYPALFVAFLGNENTSGAASKE
jgi:predicted membrane-bound dolichyl-phosphate-mannose-protein mannosyltransferase